MRELKLEGGDGNAVPFYLSPTIPKERLLANMRENIARGLPEAKMCKAHTGTLSIAGGGPSLADTYKHLEGFVCAINGSLSWLIGREGLPEGLSYACGVCDAGAHITDQVEAHPDVRYYIASVCDPSLFEKLKDCDVRLFHITPASHECEEEMTKLLNTEYDEWIAIGGGCTMGLRWMNLGYFLGFRRFRLHGLDSSFRAGSTHAYPDRADMKQHMEFRDRITRPNFIAQVYDFAEMLEIFHDLNPYLDIEVYGEGLLQDEWNLFREANPRAFKGPPMLEILEDTARMRADALLCRLPAGEVRGAEVGVFSARMSRLLLRREDLHLIMVDAWLGDGVTYLDKNNWHAQLSQEDQDNYHAASILNTNFASDRRKVMHMLSLEAAPLMGLRSLDFVFIDADHSYEAVRLDINAWVPSIKPGGWLCGHDYGGEFPGVKQAVDEFVSTFGLSLELDDDTTWFVRCP